MSWFAWSLVIFLTSLAAFWVGNRITHPKRAPVEHRPPPPPAELPRAGRFDLPNTLAPFAGASQTGQLIPWELASAAYALGQQRASADEVTREVAAIIAEIEADPRWRYR